MKFLLGNSGMTSIVNWIVMSYQAPIKETSLTQASVMLEYAIGEGPKH
jgi:hypothetical protein